MGRAVDLLIPAMTICHLAINLENHGRVRAEVFRMVSAIICQPMQSRSLETEVHVPKIMC